jgi:hypothetical protein
MKEVLETEKDHRFITNSWNMPIDGHLPLGDPVSQFHALRPQAPGSGCYAALELQAEPDP